MTGHLEVHVSIVQTHKPPNSFVIEGHFTLSFY